MTSQPSLDAPNQATAGLVMQLIAAESWLHAANDVPARTDAPPDLLELLHQARVALQKAIGEQSAQVSKAQAIATTQNAQDVITNSQQQLLSAIIASSDDAILSIDPTGIVTSWNHGAEKLFGYAANEMIGQSIGILMTADHPDEHLQLLEKINAGENIAHHETTRRRKDGRVVPVSLTMSPIFDATGKIIGASKISRDITERKKAEVQQQLLSAIVMSADDTILSVDSMGIVTSWNQGAENLFGYSAAEMIGQSIAILMAADRPDEQLPLLGKTNNGESISRHETTRRRKDGRIMPISLTMSPIFNAKGKIIGASAIARDITQRKQAEKNLLLAIKQEQSARAQAEDLHERLTFLLEASTFLADAVNYRERLQQLTQLAVPRLADWCVVDVMADDGTMHRLAAAHIDPTKTILVSQFLERFPPHSSFPVGLYQVLQTNQATLFSNTEMLRQYAQDDPERLAAMEALGLNSLMIVPLIAHNRILGVVSFAISVSDRHYNDRDLELAKDLANRSALLIENARLYDEAQQINAELEKRVTRRTAQLETANQELEAFSYSVSHDLRTPLRAIDGFSRMIIRDYESLLPEDGQRRLRIIRENAQQMGQLIDDLLAFSRLNRQPLRKRPINMGDLVRQTLEKLSTEQQNRQVEMTIGDLPEANGDPALLQQVLLNLLANALKFTRPRPIAQITIGYEFQQSEGQSAYFVRDNGVGFDMQYSNKLFGVFQRLHRPEDFEGTGVGLAIVQRVIHRHGGRVWGESEPDRGTTFYFTLEEAQYE
jgi:PAS domain S-box-containing protein